MKKKNNKKPRDAKGCWQHHKRNEQILSGALSLGNTLTLEPVSRTVQK